MNIVNHTIITRTVRGETGSFLYQMNLCHFEYENPEPNSKSDI